MRSLRVTLYTPKPVVLPLAYNELVQGLLYSCWRDRFPELHDGGYLGIRAFRPFTFSSLGGKSSIDRQRRTIKFDECVTFEVRTPFEELLDELASQLAHRGTARLGAHDLQLINLESRDRLMFPQRCLITLKTPVVAYVTQEDGHTKYFEPSDAEWLNLIQSNAARKAEALLLPDGDRLQLIPLVETLKKHVTRFKGTYVTGWTGDMICAADPQLMAALWCLGLGSKNSQGFGMFSIAEKPL